MIWTVGIVAGGILMFFGLSVMFPTGLSRDRVELQH